MIDEDNEPANFPEIRRAQEDEVTEPTTEVTKPTTELTKPATKETKGKRVEFEVVELGKDQELKTKIVGFEIAK